MNIIGGLVILFLPYLAGYILKMIFNKKETNQIETYLLGFFFVFLLQGVVFTGGYFGGFGFEKLCSIFTIVIIGVAAAGAICAVIDLVRHILIARQNEKAKQEGGDDAKDILALLNQTKWHRSEWMLLLLLLVILAAIVVRVFLLVPYLRLDTMIETMRTTLATHTIYEYNPITSRPFELGLITSKKIISLPIYYSYFCEVFGMNEVYLLFALLTIQTIVCTYMSSTQLMAPLLGNRKKVLIFCVFLGAMILSGDYFHGSIVERILWYGYAGDAIAASVMLPYVLYVLTNWYREERGDFGKTGWGNRIISLLKIGLCIVSSVFITSLATGALILIITAVVAGVCCMIRFSREEVE